MRDPVNALAMFSPLSPEEKAGASGMCDLPAARAAGRADKPLMRGGDNEEIIQ